MKAGRMGPRNRCRAVGSRSAAMRDPIRVSQPIVALQLLPDTMASNAFKVSSLPVSTQRSIEVHDTDPLPTCHEGSDAPAAHASSPPAFQSRELSIQMDFRPM